MEKGDKRVQLFEGESEIFQAHIHLAKRHSLNGGRGDQSSRLRSVIEDGVSGGDPGSCRQRRRERRDFSLAHEKEVEVWAAPSGVGGVVDDTLGRRKEGATEGRDGRVGG
ncbi:hypothetical protein LR48_Vigan50s008000 [Vigna angularis]|uniref:Uncharacterized protein n=1 Tax=Phaseolus angularis TaxID=3914 RepID=A0A0L9T3I1_PHAAN|nr:hypothetical protein LR48_Vigan50s008000 [Vigna angularis]